MVGATTIIQSATSMEVAEVDHGREATTITASRSAASGHTGEWRHLWDRSCQCESRAGARSTLDLDRHVLLSQGA
ncbi:hypothetical protein ACF1BQ_019165 [Bradyrhizobium sp. RDT10]